MLRPVLQIVELPAQDLRGLLEGRLPDQPLAVGKVGVALVQVS